MARGSRLVHRTDDQELTYSYATTSADRISDLQAYMDDQDRAGKLSDHKVFREYLKSARYALPEGVANPKSLIALAVETVPMRISVSWQGRSQDVLVPPQYYSTGMTPETLRDIVTSGVIGADGHEVERMRHGHMKLLAVRTGLGRYGRNNICYVEGMGTCITLYAFVTDFEFPEDEWTDVAMMESCADCRICRESCPTGAIPDEGFVLDVAKCIPLYNEVDGDFPSWLPEDAHNALVGCMRCQLPCPGNRDVLTRTGRLEGLSESEVAAILSDAPEEEAVRSAADKLRIDVTDGELRQVIARNLRALLREETA